jgi:hypothetical protein
MTFNPVAVAFAQSASTVCSRLSSKLLRRVLVFGAAGLGLVLASESRVAAQQVASTAVTFYDGEAALPGANNTMSGLNSSSSGNATFVSGSGSGNASVTASELSGAPDLHASLTSNDNGLGAGGSATATFSDSVNFLPSLSFVSGPPTSFKLVYFVSGSLMGSANAGLNVDYGTNGAFFNLTGGQQLFDFVAGAGDLTHNYPLGFYSGSLSESLNVGAYAGGAQFGFSYSSSSADFKDTAELQEIDVTDANGNPVQGTFFDTNSDGTPGPISFAANTNLLATPEPSTWALFLSGGILLLLGYSYRRPTLNQSEPAL